LSFTSAIAPEDHPQLQHIEREQDGGRAEARRLTFNAFSLGLLSLGADVVAMMSGMRARSQPTFPSVDPATTAANQGSSLEELSDPSEPPINLHRMSESII
jgi:hypothetical protein